MDNTWFEKMEERIRAAKYAPAFAPSPTGYMHVGNLHGALHLVHRPPRARQVPAPH